MARGFGFPRIPQLPGPPPGNVVDRILKALESLAAEYVDPPFYQITRLNLAASGSGAQQVITSNQNRLQWLVVTVQSGDLLVQVGGGGSIVAPGDLRYLPTAQPWVTPLASQPYTFTVQSNGVATIASFIMVGG